MGNGDELRRGCESLKNLDPTAARSTERAAEGRRGFDRDAALHDSVAQVAKGCTGIPCALGKFGKRLAIGLRDILSRDSATRSWQRRRGRRGAAPAWPESEVDRGGAFRTELPRLFKNVRRFWRPALR